MYNHAPDNYVCPLCLAINGVENDQTMMKQADLIYRDDLVVAAINSKFVVSNSGHVIIFPLQHYENIYDLPENVANHIIKVAKQMALALKKVRNCEGITILQNNEPAGGQHAFHYHLHVFPRFTGDHFDENMSKTDISTPLERTAFSSALKTYLNNIVIN